eukprot:scaffold3.g6656.t1
MLLERLRGLYFAPLKAARRLLELLRGLPTAGLGTTLRCAGGWVRDKLMGRASLDIDIALDNLLGREFAERVNDYLKAHGQETHHIAVIMSNPDQSKHLETARMRLRGHWIDLVNLRSEEYAHHSRIPTMTFGTPEEDALRRDFTINSLFYNLNTGAIEDFSQKGWALSTYPLRVMRAVRFASRFGFELEESLLEAAGDQEVRDHLHFKVSRERIGTEFQGMVHGPDPVLALQLIHRLRLFEAVFVLPDAVAASLPSEELSAAATALAAGAYDALAALDSEPPGPEAGGVGRDARRQLLLAALLLPLRALSVRGHKGRPMSVPAHVVREALKWPAKDADAVDALHAAAPRLLAIAARLQGLEGEDGGLPGAGSNGNGAAGGGNGAGRKASASAARAPTHVAAPDDLKVELGRAIRQLKGLWRAGCVLAPLLCTAEATPLGVEPSEVPPTSPRLGGGGGAAAAAAAHAVSPSGEAEAPAVGARLATVRTLEAAAAAFKLTDCYQWKPVLDGKKVMAVLNMEAGGPRLGRAMEALVDWQLAHPDGSPDEAREWLRQHHGMDTA